MPSEIDDLRAEIAALRADNDRLRTGGTLPVTPITPAAPGGASRANKRDGWRALVSAVCIVIAGILVPISIVATWTRTQLVDEAAFVQTFAPLADDPDVQALIIGEATAAIEDSLDIESFTNDLFDGIATLDLPPAALRALDLLRQPAVSGIQSLIDTTVTRVVESDAFADVWERALQVSHRALVATATNDGTGAVTIDQAGTLGIQLGPIIEELKQRLVDQGITFAASIPPVTHTIVLVQSEALALVGTIYSLAVTVVWWLPVIALALLVVGIVVARRRFTALLGTGVAILVGAGLLWIGLDSGRIIVSLSAPQLGLPPRALDAAYAMITAAMRDTTIVITFLGAVIALAAWLGGRWAPARRVRALSGSLTSRARAGLARWGLDTGSFGDWMHRQRVLVRLMIVVLAVLLLIALRPLSVSDIVLTVVLALIVWLCAELLQREADETAAGHGAGTEALGETETGAQAEAATQAAPEDDEAVEAAAAPAASVRSDDSTVTS
ncbi:hypothetical protein AB1K54_04490 [Microbacterium sp. BWT-B31]|uniref:hypothetical protein n=1 Tax=Microbacterium sp. BWT-B31 TaxID=3232072 RepID=UPI003527CD8A